MTTMLRYRIILVLPHSQQDYWRLLCREYRFSLPHAIADGGETRFHSVKNGLALVKTPALVGVHDGVRPFVAREVIARCYDLAAEKKAVIPVIGVVETVRRMEGKGSVTVGRDDYRLVQTPQVFDAELLKADIRAALCTPILPMMLLWWRHWAYLSF